MLRSAGEALASASDPRSLLPDGLDGVTVYELKVDPREIIRDDTLQARQNLRPEAIRRYAIKYAEREHMPPLWCWQEPETGDLVLLEGWHRREGAEQAGLKEIPVVVFDGLDWDQAAMLAARANLNHGVPLNNRERRKAMRMGWKGRYCTMSVRQIAAEIGTSKSNVARWIQEDGLERPDDLQEEYEDGRGVPNGTADDFSLWSTLPVGPDGKLNDRHAGRYLAFAGDLKGLTKAMESLSVARARQEALKQALSVSQRVKLLELLEKTRDDLERVFKGDLSDPPGLSQ